MIKNLVFVGGGHAQLHPLSRLNEYRDLHARVTVISPGRFWYSGMGPGMIAGQYSVSDDTIQIHRVQVSGGVYLQDYALRIDTENRRVILANNSPVAYDFLCLNVGSEVPVREIPGAAQFGVPVKPIKNLHLIRRRLLEMPGNEMVRVVVAGGGDAGCEVAANISHLTRQIRTMSEVHLVCSQDRLLSAHTHRAGALMENYLRRIGVILHKDRRVAEAREGEVTLDNNQKLKSDLLVVATGIRPPGWIGSSGLATASDGGLLVNEFLQSASHPNVFGGGDCVHFHERALPKTGVYAVRQSAVLHENLKAAIQGKPLRPYRPQKLYLLILNLGDGTGLLTRGDYAAHGRWAFWLKNWIDRRFMRKHQRIYRGRN